MTDFERLQRLRQELLEQAVEDSIHWCFNPEKEPKAKRVSDQYWLCLLSGDKLVELEHAHKFLVTYQLVKMKNWDKLQVAGVMNRLVQNLDFNPGRDIPTIAGQLAACITSKNSFPQTSAASKIAMYAKPNAPVFIWDQLAMRSARIRANNTGDDIHQVFRNEDGSHDYAGFAAACAAALAAERQNADFCTAVDRFIEYLAAQGGPMANAPRDFVERRLLDKLMFWEGWNLRKWKEERKAARAGSKAKPEASPATGTDEPRPMV